jgi:hypothetical protein
MYVLKLPFIYFVFHLCCRNHNGLVRTRPVVAVTKQMAPQNQVHPGPMRGPRRFPPPLHTNEEETPGSASRFEIFGRHSRLLCQNIQRSCNTLQRTR